MTLVTPRQSDPLARERLVIVGEDIDDIATTLAHRLPEWTCTRHSSPLAAIADVARRPATAIVVMADTGFAQLNNAVAGLRLATDRRTRLVLCCHPETEPTARAALDHGADDYFVVPIVQSELEGALGLADGSTAAMPKLTATPAASMEELEQLGGILADLGGGPAELLDRIAQLLHCALPTRGATIVVAGTVATSGDAGTKPVLSVPLKDGSRVIGHASIGEPLDAPYAPSDTKKLEHYATLAGHLIAAADRQRQWHRLSVTDEASGLPNRRYLLQRLDEILEKAREARFPVTLLLFDVDNFKSFNDEFGHDVGDEVIRLAGDLFRKACRDQDVVARYGGDEFAVVFWDDQGARVAGSRHPSCALDVIERVNQSLQHEDLNDLIASFSGQITISGGLASYPWDAATRSELITRADQALLAAKRAGKNRVFIIGERPGQAPHPA